MTAPATALTDAVDTIQRQRRSAAAAKAAETRRARLEPAPIGTPYTIGNLTVSIVRDAAVLPGPVVRKPADSAAIFTSTQPDDGREHFRIMLVDVRRRVIGVHTVSVGSQSVSIVHPREVFRVAILGGAAAIVCSHNHPSGDPEPSAEDIALTRRLAQAGALVGIEILDHIITGNGSERFVSLKERGVV